MEQLRRDRVEELVEQARKSSSRRAPPTRLPPGIRDLMLPFFIKMGARSARMAYSYGVHWEQNVEPANVFAS